MAWLKRIVQVEEYEVDEDEVAADIVRQIRDWVNGRTFSGYLPDGAHYNVQISKMEIPSFVVTFEWR